LLVSVVVDNSRFVDTGSAGDPCRS
jgi:hypothetical protein